MTSQDVAIGDDTGGRKAVLHCGNCGHDSLADGDWVLHERRGSRSVWYQCPDCRHAVTVRPIDSLDGSQFPAPLSRTHSQQTFDSQMADSNAALWESFWRSCRDVTTAWLSPWHDDEARAD